MAPQSCNVFVVARFRPMNSREKEISTKGVDEKGFKIQCAANPPTALDYPVMTHGVAGMATQMWRSPAERLMASRNLRWISTSSAAIRCDAARMQMDRCNTAGSSTRTACRRTSLTMWRSARSTTSSAALTAPSSRTGRLVGLGPLVPSSTLIPDPIVVHRADSVADVLFSRMQVRADRIGQGPLPLPFRRRWIAAVPPIPPKCPEYSGKTFTMMGPDISGDPALNGIIPRSSLQVDAPQCRPHELPNALLGTAAFASRVGALVTHAEVRGVYSLCGMQIFDHIEGDDTGTEFVIKCSYMEIYNEQVPSSCVH